MPAASLPASPHVPARAGATGTGAALFSTNRHVPECRRASAYREPATRVQRCTINFIWSRWSSRMSV